MNKNDTTLRTRKGKLLFNQISSFFNLFSGIPPITDDSEEDDDDDGAREKNCTCGKSEQDNVVGTPLLGGQ